MSNSDLRLSTQARGTRLLLGEDARHRRLILDKLMAYANRMGFEEVVLPSLELAKLYKDKAGPEVLEQMYVFKDKGGRDLSLRPEGTATLQLLCEEHIQRKDVMLWYEARCWRYERPQAGRYREFTQFGMEILNPSQDYSKTMHNMSKEMVAMFTDEYLFRSGVKRGFAYYTGGEGWEIRCLQLGAQQQVLGGGAYEQGIGFAIGVDRLMLAAEKTWSTNNGQ